MKVRAGEPEHTGAQGGSQGSRLRGLLRVGFCLEGLSLPPPQEQCFLCDFPEGEEPTPGAVGQAGLGSVLSWGL